MAELDLALETEIDPFDPTAPPVDRILRPVDDADLPDHLLDSGTASLVGSNDTAAAQHSPAAARVQHSAAAASVQPRARTYPLEVVGPDEVRAPIRAWFDDEGRLVRLVISNRWRERLLGRDLGEEITATLREPANAAAAVEAPAQPIALPTQLTQEWLDEMYEASTRDYEQARAAADSPSTTVGRSRGRTVTVELGADGLTRSVMIDPVWLSRCRVHDLCEAVIEAHQSALDALTRLPRTGHAAAASMAARTDALFAVLTGRTAA